MVGQQQPVKGVGWTSGHQIQRPEENTSMIIVNITKVDKFSRT